MTDLLVLDLVDKRLVTDQLVLTVGYDIDYMYEQKKKEEEDELAREKKLQKTMLEIKKKHGKNAILKGMNLEEGATTLDRNKQIGGHKA